MDPSSRTRAAMAAVSPYFKGSMMITLSCGIKISAVSSIVLLQSTRVTDRQTDGLPDGQNYDPQDRASIVASRGKNWNYMDVNKNQEILQRIEKRSTK